MHPKPLTANSATSARTKAAKGPAIIVNAVWCMPRQRGSHLQQRHHHLTPLLRPQTWTCACCGAGRGRSSAFWLAAGWVTPQHTATTARAAATPVSAVSVAVVLLVCREFPPSLSGVSVCCALQLPSSWALLRSPSCWVLLCSLPAECAQCASRASLCQGRMRFADPCKTSISAPDKASSPCQRQRGFSSSCAAC